MHAWNATPAHKTAVIEALALAIERGGLRLLDHTVQTGELIAYASERLPSGVFRYGAPRGMHDDTVIALALAWTGVERELPANVAGHDPFGGSRGTGRQREVEIQGVRGEDGRLVAVSWGEKRENTPSDTGLHFSLKPRVRSRKRWGE